MKVRHSIATLLACVVTSAMILVATPLPASADDLDTRNPIPLINVGSTKCFAPTPQDGHVDWAGLPIQQRTCDVADFRQFYKFVPLGFVVYNGGDPPWYCIWPFKCYTLGNDGFFIQNKDTGLCMDVRDGARSDGAVVQQWTCRDKNARSMVWYTEPSDFPHALKLRNLNSDLCLDVSWGSSDEYAQLQQYHCTSNNAAQNFWQILSLGPTWGHPLGKLVRVKSWRPSLASCGLRRASPLSHISRFTSSSSAAGLASPSPQARPHDGGRRDCDQRGGQGLSVHGAPAGRHGQTVTRHPNEFGQNLAVPCIPQHHTTPSSHRLVGCAPSCPHAAGHSLADVLQGEIAQ